LNGLSPQYLASDCQLTSTAGRRRLRSSNVTTCEVPRTRTSLGSRLFTVAGPRLWNNLPLHLRDSEHTFLYRVPPVTEDAPVLLGQRRTCRHNRRLCCTLKMFWPLQRSTKESLHEFVCRPIMYNSECLLFVPLINLHLHYITLLSKSVVTRLCTSVYEIIVRSLRPTCQDSVNAVIRN